MRPPLGLRLTLLFAATLTVMSGAAISPSLPMLRAHFADVPQAEVLSRLVLTIPALSIALTAPFSGWATDRIGRRRVLIWATVLYVIAGSSGLYLESLPMILVGRALLGVAVGGVMTTATTLIGDSFDGPARDRFTGFQVSMAGLSGVVFLSASGVLADISWRGPFAVYLTGALLVPLALLFVKPRPRPLPEERPAHGPAQDVPVPGNPRWLLPLLFGAAFIAMMSFYILPTQLPFYFADELGVSSARTAGFAIALSTLFSTLGSMSFGWVRSRVPLVVIFAMGFGAMSLGAALITVSEGTTLIWPAMALIGGGMGTMMPGLMVAVLTAAPPAQRGRVSGGLTSALFLGQFISPILTQPIGNAYGLATAFEVLAIFLGLLTLCIALSAIRVRRLRAAG